MFKSNQKNAAFINETLDFLNLIDPINDQFSLL